MPTMSNYKREETNAGLSTTEKVAGGGFILIIVLLLIIGAMVGFESHRDKLKKQKAQSGTQPASDVSDATSSPGFTNTTVSTPNINAANTLTPELSKPAPTHPALQTFHNKQKKKRVCNKNRESEQLITNPFALELNPPKRFSTDLSNSFSEEDEGGYDMDLYSKTEIPKREDLKESIR